MKRSRKRQVVPPLITVRLSVLTLPPVLHGSLQFNVLWLNPSNEATFPPGLMDALALHSNAANGGPAILGVGGPSSSAAVAALVAHKERLRAQMHAEALTPLDVDGNEQDDGDEQQQNKVKKAVSAIDQWEPDMLEEATQFLRLQVCRWFFLSRLRNVVASFFNNAKNG